MTALDVITLFDQWWRDNPGLGEENKAAFFVVWKAAIDAAAARPATGPTVLSEALSGAMPVQEAAQVLQEAFEFQALVAPAHDAVVPITDIQRYAEVKRSTTYTSPESLLQIEKIMALLVEPKSIRQVAAAIGFGEACVRGYLRYLTGFYGDRRRIRISGRIHHTKLYCVGTEPDHRSDYSLRKKARNSKAGERKAQWTKELQKRASEIQPFADPMTAWIPRRK